MIEQEFKYYQDHKKELIQKYNNRFIVIKDRKVIADFSSREEAIAKTQKEHKLGTFLVQFVSANDEQVQRFYSRVRFDRTNAKFASRLHN